MSYTELLSRLDACISCWTVAVARLNSHQRLSAASCLPARHCACCLPTKGSACTPGCAAGPGALQQQPVQEYTGLNVDGIINKEVAADVLPAQQDTTTVLPLGGAGLQTGGAGGVVPAMLAAQAAGERLALLCVVCPAPCCVLCAACYLMCAI